MLRLFPFARRMPAPGSGRSTVGPRPKRPACCDLTGVELAGDKVGNLICGWMIKSKDGSQMKMAPHPALAHRMANHVGDAVAVIVAETLAQAKDGAEKINVDYEPLPAVTDPAKAQAEGTPQIHEVAARNTIYQWHLGDQKAAEGAFTAAHHVTRLDFINNRLAPNAIEPRAAIGEYDFGTDGLTLWNTTQNSGRRAAGDFRVRRDRARAQVAGDRARCRRRLRHEDLSPIREEVLVSGRRVGSAGRSNGWLTAWRRSSPTPMAATNVTPCAAGVDEKAGSRARASTPRRHGRRYVDVLGRRSPSSALDGLHAARVNTPSAIYASCSRRLHQHRAGRCLPRRRPAGGDARGRTLDGGQCPRDGRGSRRSAQEELHQEISASDPGDHER